MNEWAPVESRDPVHKSRNILPVVSQRSFCSLEIVTHNVLIPNSLEYLESSSSKKKAFQLSYRKQCLILNDIPLRPIII